ncbi:hypothetical protein L1987_36184 [Smallanthus sonchifolius]|uniref:Uncharacterized protein n=1 Tax=Smallanthus sonchifolius TaxID=185202 RepID=A0ACB9HEI9_9ASTR|nr:hypothetical protein L1987_36184 [Smallanthus sonchifolius]
MDSCETRVASSMSCLRSQPCGQASLLDASILSVLIRIKTIWTVHSFLLKLYYKFQTPFSLSFAERTRVKSSFPDLLLRS